MHHDTDQLFAELVKAGDEALAALLAGFGLDALPPRVPTVRPAVCAWCGGPIRVRATGRPALFCSDAHRLSAWRAARAELHVAQQDPHRAALPIGD
jgi:hypothetical protein